MAATARHSARLMALLHGFGLSPSELAKQQPKAVISTLRREYYRLAKEQHPDHVPEDQKAEATQRFVRLQGDFHEAMKLLEAGIQPWMASPGASGSPPSGSRFMYAPPFHAAYGQSQKLEPMQFDLKTRIKGHTIFWSSLFFFFCGFREFLVWSAGSTASWHPPKDWNPLKVRRYREDWTESAAENRKAKQDDEAEGNVKEKAAVKAQKPESSVRQIDDFYTKRGISNVRRKTYPRGFGPSL